MPTSLKTLPRRLAAAVLLLALPFAICGEAFATDFDKSVFEYQSKLANSGNAEAQYYLAQMYEEGRGTLASPELARQWYETSKKNGYTPSGQVASN